MNPNGLEEHFNRPALRDKRGGMTIRLPFAAGEWARLDDDARKRENRSRFNRANPANDRGQGKD